MLKELPKDIKLEEVEAALKKEKLEFLSTVILAEVDQQKAIGSQEYEALIKDPKSKLLEQTMVLVEFKDRSSYVKALKRVMQGAKPVEIKKGVEMKSLMHKRFGDYNSESSVCVGFLNPRCTDQDIIAELNALLKAEAKKKQEPNFVASCIVLLDPETRRSKQTAFVDFNNEDAAKICISKWHNSSMQKFPNRLQVTKFESEHKKIS